MEEIHLTKKDFSIDWYSGQGAGGQHRNKHQNCCRITHIETGLVGVGSESRSRVTNQHQAFTRLANKILSFYKAKESKERFNCTEVIRNYHGVRNEVHDKESGLKMPYKDIVDRGDIVPMINARRASMMKSTKTI